MLTMLTMLIFNATEFRPQGEISRRLNVYKSICCHVERRETPRGILMRLPIPTIPTMLSIPTIPTLLTKPTLPTKSLTLTILMPRREPGH